MRLRELNIGCVGGGTGLPSPIGGLKGNPWLSLSAVVTMFDSGGSSASCAMSSACYLRDVLKCALALARNEREARSALLSRLPMLEQHDRLAGHRWQSAALDDGAYCATRRWTDSGVARVPRESLSVTVERASTRGVCRWHDDSR